jgi:hypothetical protein
MREHIAFLHAGHQEPLDHIVHERRYENPILS